MCWWIFTRGHRDEERRETHSLARGLVVVLVDRRVEVALAREELDGRLDLADVQAEARRDDVHVAALVARAVLRVVIQDPLPERRHLVQLAEQFRRFGYTFIVQVLDLALAADDLLQPETRSDGVLRQTPVAYKKSSAK